MRNIRIAFISRKLSNQKIWSIFNSVWTHEKLCRCYIAESVTIDVKSNPPERCPYYLEHLVTKSC